MSEPETILQTAVEVYLAGCRGQPDPADPGLLRLITQELDHLIGAASRWSEPQTARCLLILALARRQGQLDLIEAALKHGLAESGIDLPLAAPQPLQPASSGYRLLQSGPIAEDSAKDLCALLSQIGCYVALETVLTWSQEQYGQAELYARRRRQRTWKPVDVPERPDFLPNE